MLCSLLCPQDLSRLGRDIRKVVIIDNSPQSYIFHPDNAVSDRQARSIASVYVRVCKNAHVRFYTPPPLHLCMFEYVRTRMSGFTHHRHYMKQHVCSTLAKEYEKERMPQKVFSQCTTVVSDQASPLMVNTQNVNAG